MTDERRVVELPVRPPSRLFDGARFRSLKRIADHLVWEQAWQRITDLVADGWTVQRVTVDWGKRVPGLAPDRARWLELMCGDPPALTQMISGQGKGRTTVELTRGQHSGV